MYNAIMVRCKLKSIIVVVVVVVLNLILLQNVVLSSSSVFQDCGVREEEIGDSRTFSPWTVSIFLRRNSAKPFKYFISGTILNPTTILSLYGGSFGNPTRGSKYFIPNPDNIKIIAGLQTTRIEDQDQFSQSSQINFVVPFTKHSKDNKVYHYYIIHLRQAFNLKTPYVRAICLPQTGRKPKKKIHDFKNFLNRTNHQNDHRHHDHDHDEKYRVSGYFLGGFSFINKNVRTGVQHLSLRQINLTSENRCARQFHENYHNGPTKHVLCGVENYHSSVHNNDDTCVLHGGALFYEARVESENSEKIQKRWFLRGLNSLIPSLKLGKCSRSSMYFFGNFEDSLDWILRNLKCGPQNFACPSGFCIPHQNVCNSINDCAVELSDDDAADEKIVEDENQIFCQATNPCTRLLLSKKNNGENFHRCGLYEKCIPDKERCDGILNCPNGSDEAPQMCKNSSFPNQNGHNNNNNNFVYTELTIENNEEKEFPSLLKEHEGSLWSKTCFPLQLSDGVVATCKNPETNQNILCHEANSGTEVTLECDEQYRSTMRSSQVRMRCNLEGNWIPFKPFACEVDCGIIGSGFSFHLTFGKKVSQNNAFPWYAAIYKENEKTKKLEFICGGNLIEKNALITAAHCITNANGLQLTSNLFTIVLAPVSIDLEVNSRDRHTQIIRIENMFIPPSFNYQLLQSDIAVLKLAKPAILNDFVRPVCYLPSFFSDYPTPGTVGKVAGLGYDETRQVSKVIKFLSFPVVSQDECREALQRIPLLSTFCAGYKNGSAVCKGDSGSGLAFPEHNGDFERYVLKGIVSHGQVTDGRLCDQENYAVFTHIDSFKPFIVSVLDAIDKNLTMLNNEHGSL